mmetsp:Transcript_8074/g.17571  ORF Transcript_8074/g.17571 Transcript_8074/m.17571 type:complete len:346 (+) Transcript_8074:493-1530(+)
MKFEMDNPSEGDSTDNSPDTTDNSTVVSVYSHEGKEDRRKFNRGRDQRKSYSKEQKLAVIEMRDTGLTFIAIAARTGMIRANIEKWCSDLTRRKIMGSASRPRDKKRQSEHLEHEHSLKQEHTEEEHKIKLEKCEPLKQECEECAEELLDQQLQKKTWPMKVNVTKVKVEDMRKRRCLSMQKHLATVSDDSVIESIPMQVQVSSIPQMELKMEPIQDMQMHTTQQMSVAQQNHYAYYHHQAHHQAHHQGAHTSCVSHSSHSHSDHRDEHLNPHPSSHSHCHSKRGRGVQDMWGEEHSVSGHMGHAHELDLAVWVSDGDLGSLTDDDDDTAFLRLLDDVCPSTDAY